MLRGTMGVLVVSDISLLIALILDLTRLLEIANNLVLMENHSSHRKLVMCSSLVHVCEKSWQTLPIGDILKAQSGSPSIKTDLSNLIFLNRSNANQESRDQP